MSTRPLIVIGAGGFGREVLDVLNDINESYTQARWQILGVLDDSPSQLNLSRLADRGVRHLGSIDSWLAGSPPNVDIVIAVGAPLVRRTISQRLDSAVAPNYPIIIHPNVHVGSMASLGPGTVVCGGAHISTNVEAGRHVHINPNATVGHDARFGNWVSVNPAATVSGECYIEDGVLIGAGSVVLQNLRVGRYATVGASACVTKDIPSKKIVKGVPAT